MLYTLTRKLNRWLPSLVIVTYLAYAFVTGMPREWQPIHIGFFPWNSWAMFDRGAPFHAELIAVAKAASGREERIPGREFFPPTTRWALEGNRADWIILRRLHRNAAFSQALCDWMLTKYNRTAPANQERITRLELAVAVWPLPPRTALPPTRELRVAECAAAPTL